MTDALLGDVGVSIGERAVGRRWLWSSMLGSGIGISGEQLMDSCTFFYYLAMFLIAEARPR